MRRTEMRPLPAGRLQPRQALRFGLALSVVATIYLALLVNPLSAALGVLTFAAYLFAYTPLKTRTTLSTIIGAFPGAMPPFIGWVAANGQITIEAWVLFAILFLWQFPHFLAIAWMYRDDHKRAGIKMLPVNFAVTGRPSSSAPHRTRCWPCTPTGGSASKPTTSTRRTVQAGVSWCTVTRTRSPTSVKWSA